MAIEYQLTLADYLSITRRRAPYMIGIFVSVLLITIIVAVTFPPVYRSSGTILVESPQVPDSMVPSMVKTQLDERINVIKQRVMTRESLLKIINKYNLFKDERASTTSELLDKMRARIGIELINVEVTQNNRSGKLATAFSVSYEDRHPEVAHQVAKDLVTLFLDLNVKLRTEGATETTLFLTQESEKLKAEVDRLEGLISSFKSQNSGNLPEQLGLRSDMLARAENDLYEVERDTRSTTEALRALEAELSAAKSGMGEDPSQALTKLKAELANLSAIYTESHPDIRALKRKIDSLEKSSGKSDAAVAAPSLAVYIIQAKVDAANARLESLGQQKKMLQSKIAQNERAMLQTPKAAQELAVLVRDRDSAQKKYEELLGKKVNAQIAQSMESENKSERFELLEPPILPEKAFKPDRVKIVVMGFFLAIASAGGVIMLLETFDKRVRGVEAFTHVVGHRPLVVIPYFPAQEDEVAKKRMRIRMLVAMVVAVVAILALLHFLYMPLDILLVKILARLA